MIGAEINAINTKSKEVLGIKYERNLQASLIEMGYSMIDKGLLPDRRKR